MQTDFRRKGEVCSMGIYGELVRLSECAKADESLRKELLASAEGADPMKSFCDVCLKNGFKIYLGELFAYGEDMNDSKLRSVNGGGVNAIEGWNDAFAQIISELREMDK